MIHISRLFIEAFTPNEQLIMLRLLLNADADGKVEFSDRGMSKATGIPYQQVRTIHQNFLACGTITNAVANAASNANHVFVTICDYDSYNAFNIFSNAVANAVINALEEKESVKKNEKVFPHTPLQIEKENNKEKEILPPTPLQIVGGESDKFLAELEELKMRISSLSDENKKLQEENAELMKIKKECEAAAEKKKPKKNQTLGGKARDVFVEYYDNLSISDEPYYWTAKDAGNMKQLLNKIKFSRESRGLDVDDDSMIFALNAFLNSISDQWILQHLETATINSKYNEIVAKAKKAGEMPSFPDNPKHGDTIGYDWYYDAYELHRWIKDRETDEKGRVFSVQNGRWLK